MRCLAVGFLIMALGCGVLGFFAMAGAAGAIARVLFIVFSIFLIIALFRRADLDADRRGRDIRR